MRRIPATFVRGGTSRALVFRSRDLPSDRALWPKLFARALGSPDPLGYQLDGLGGGITSLSKVAVVDSVKRPESEIDYLFFQVDPRSGEVSTLVNCGNISSAVGPFALANGWIQPDGNEVLARVHNLNSGKVIEARFRAQPGSSELISIDGVGGVGAPIRLRFVEPGGSVAPSTFPTGRRQDEVTLSGGRVVRCTLIDSTVPTVIAAAADFGVACDEPAAQLATRRDLLTSMADLRIQAGVAMGLAADAQHFRTTLWNLPDVVLVAPAGSREGVRARFFSADTPHRAAPVTSSLALGSALSLDGTLPAEWLGPRPSRAEDAWEIQHPSGKLDVWVEADEQRSHVCSASVLRTARLLMEGHVLIPD